MNCKLCNNPVKARGLCGKHHERWRRSGESYDKFIDPPPEIHPSRMFTCVKCDFLPPIYGKDVCARCENE